MFCSKCGTQNEDSSNFCTKCSQPLNQAASAPQPGQPQPQQPAQPFLQAQSQWPNQPNQPFQQGQPNQAFQQGQSNQPFQQGQPNQAFQQIPQGQPQQQWPQPIPSSGQARVAKKSNPALVILIVVVCLVVAFFVWAALSPDDVPAGDDTAMESQGEADAETSGSASAVESPEEAVALVRALVGIDSLVFNHEETIINEEDGTYRIDINTPELANADCYVVGPPENGEAMFELYDYFYVVKRTDLVLRLNPANDLMEQVTGPIPEERGSVESEPEASVAVEPKESEKTDAVMDADATLAFLKTKTGDNSLEFLREENFIGNSDGSLTIDINGESGSEACYLFAPANFEDVAGYVGYYAVRMGTKKVYGATLEDPGTLYEIP